jgi:hypothetical protein
MDYLIAAVKIIGIQFLIFLLMNARLKKAILGEGSSSVWIAANVAIALLIPIGCSVLGETHNFAFMLLLAFFAILQGYSSNYKSMPEVHEEVEKMQKKATKYAIFSSIIGYAIAFMKIV